METATCKLLWLSEPVVSLYVTFASGTFQLPANATGIATIAIMAIAIMIAAMTFVLGRDFAGVPGVLVDIVDAGVIVRLKL